MLTLEINDSPTYELNVEIAQRRAYHVIHQGHTTSYFQTLQPVTS